MRVNGIWGKEQGSVKEDTSRFSVAAYCLVSPSRRRSDRVLFTRKRVLWPRFWHGEGAKYAGERPRTSHNSLSACGTNFFFLVVTRPLSRRHAVKIANALESLTTCYLPGLCGTYFENIDIWRWYATSKLRWTENLYSKTLSVLYNYFKSIILIV